MNAEEKCDIVITSPEERLKKIFPPSLKIVTLQAVLDLLPLKVLLIRRTLYFNFPISIRFLSNFLLLLEQGSHTNQVLQGYDATAKQ